MAQLLVLGGSLVALVERPKPACLVRHPNHHPSVVRNSSSPAHLIFLLTMYQQQIFVEDGEAIASNRRQLVIPEDQSIVQAEK
jgi:hypothetical protein